MPPPPRPSSASLEVGDAPINARSAADQLHEVENALSLLGGRHPEFVRVEREKAEAAARRLRDLELASVRARKRAIRGGVIGAGIVAVIGTSAWFAVGRYETRRRALEGSVAAAQRFVAVGFSEVPRSVWGATDRIEVPLTAGTCAVALGAAGAGTPITIEVTHDGRTVEAQGSFGFCTCTNENVAVAVVAAAAAAAKSDDAAARSVRLLRVDARVFGSVMGFQRHATRPNSIEPCACVEEQLDGWLEHAGADALQPPEVAAIAAPLRAQLAAEGRLRLTNSIAASSPLFPLVVPAGACAIVVPSRASDTLSLRARGGARPLDAAKGPLATCTKSTRTLGVWHEGSGTVTILQSDSEQLGGRLGLQHVLERTPLQAARTWVEPEDLGWDASLALALSQAPGGRVVELEALAKVPSDARLVAFSLAPGARIEPGKGPDFACDRVEGALDFLCAQSSPQPWHEATGKARAAAAFAPLPIWMKPLANTPESTSAVVALARLARKLRLMGFEATSLEAVTEADSGASVLGRAKEDAVVAVTLQPSPPFALPLSEGPAWSLDGEPAIIPLAPGRKIALRSRLGPAGPADSRRTVVFRRAIIATNK